MTRVTIVGAGFAALTAIRRLRAAAANLHIDVVAPRPEFVYYPGTIWIPTGLRRPEAGRSSSPIWVRASHSR